ncbi:MAG: response regulator [Spirochaetes bacterium]|nr:response regulator [Spirochaetota bacterium]
MKGSRVLVVEDELITAENVRECLVQNGYGVTGMACSGKEALALLEHDVPDLSLVDIKLKGGMEGIELARRMAEDFDVPVIYLTAYSDAEIVERARETLSYGYILKPFDDRELVSAIEIAIEKHRADRAVRESARELRLINEKLRATVMGIAAAMAVVVEIRDPYTAGHQKRVAELASAIAHEMGLGDDTVQGIVIAASIHDIGKLGVPSELLSKPSRLSETEFRLIKEHSVNGYEILKSIDFPWPVARIVRQHHEKMDGTGYPDGLAGDGILVEARIITVADVVEAISSHRPYRPALGMEKALAEIREQSGRLYDGVAVEACIKIFGRGSFLFSAT